MFTPLSFLVRWCLALFVVFSTYNATGYSYFHWLTGVSTTHWPLKTFVGLVLLTTYGVFAIAIWRSMGPVGVSASAAALTAMIWTLVDYGLLDLDNPNAVATVLSALLATILAFGVSWSHIRTRLSGQVDSKDVNQY
ncbi:conserved membrane hypothetical protein [uncultured Gammaproteobacteria bacterium]